jgi:hypothetical protein
MDYVDHAYQSAGSERQQRERCGRIPSTPTGGRNTTLPAPRNLTQNLASNPPPFPIPGCPSVSNQRLVSRCIRIPSTAGTTAIHVSNQRLAPSETVSSLSSSAHFLSVKALQIY